MSQPQYSYGYGYQAYGYAQPAAMSYMQYPQQTIPYGTAPSAAQQPSVGYTPYTPTQQPPLPAKSSPQIPLPPPPGTSQMSVPNYYAVPPPPQQQPSPSSQQNHQPTNQLVGGHQTASVTPQHFTTPVKSQQQPGYYSYQQYRPATQQQQQQAATAYSPYFTQAYRPPAPVSQSSVTTIQQNIVTSVATPTISYPSYSQSNYATAANAYYKQMKTQQGYTKPKPLMAGGAMSATTTTAIGPSSQNQSNLTLQQKQVVQHYIQQKTNQAPIKKPYKPPAQQQMFYCDVCRISCASAATYKTHLEGKNHKKRLTQQRNIAEESKTGDCYCQLCDVVCSNNDSLAAHIRGVKHQKVVTLHRRLGKPVPNIKITNSTTSKAVANISQKESGKGVFVTAPRITFVGGQQLSSTGAFTGEKQPLKVYPPNATLLSSKVSPLKPLMQEGQGGLSNVITPTQPTTNDTGIEVGEPDTVGEHLVVAVKGDPKFPHATYNCQMCDCYFNDDYAKKAHVKGRRHRLNYKKMYQPDLYVEPTKQQKKDKKALGPMRGGRRSWGNGPTSPRLNKPDELRPQEHTQRQQSWTETDFGEYDYPPPYHSHYHPHDMGMDDWGWDMMQPPMSFRNPHDDRLVLNKHNTIFPQEIELKSVDMVVEDVERALKLVSDGMLVEMIDAETSGDDNEQLRELKGVMRVGAYARGVMLKGECSVQLVLMCADKPTTSFFNTVASQFQEKLEKFKTAGDTDNIYNVTPEVDKSRMIIITQVGDYRVQLTVTLTSTKMRDEPSEEEARTDKEKGVLDRANCLAALAALRHTKWFQAMCHGLPSFAIVLRVMKDICRRVPAWGVLNSWMLELMVQKCIASANPDFLKPGDVFRRIMECVASGVFLPGNTSLLDPCEKGVTDVAGVLSAQERANITLSAQHALRLIAFDKLHLVLGVDPLPPPGATKQHGGPPQGVDNKNRRSLSGGTKREAEEDHEGVEESKKIKLD